MRLHASLSAILFLVAAPIAARAATANFTLSGMDTYSQPATLTDTTEPGNPQYVNFSGYIDTGTLSFTYTGTGPITLANLSAFSLSDSLDYVIYRTYPTAPQYNYYDDYGKNLPFFYLDTITQGLSAVTSFSAVVDTSGNVTSLSFTTTPVLGSVSQQLVDYGPIGVIANTDNGVLSYEGTTTNITSYPDGIRTTGIITQVVPEPASLGLLGAGAVGLIARRRRD